MTAKDLIGLAAELIDKNGKCEGKFFDSNNGSYCTVGALNQLSHNSWAYRESDPLVEEALRLIDSHITPNYSQSEFLDGPFVRVSVGWNDVNDKATVVQKLREIASS